MKQIAMFEQEAIESSYAKTPLKSCVTLQESSAPSKPNLEGSRIKLFVESKCNVGCNYCDCEKEPSIKAATTQEAIELIRITAKQDPDLRTIEIAGHQGDALASKVTFETLSLLQEEYPHLTRCIVTNGLLLPKKLTLLKELGVRSVTVTVNAVDVEVGSKIHPFIELNGKTLRGQEAFEVLSINQLEGIRNADDAGMHVEVSSACIPSVNYGHLVDVAKTVRNLGASVMNVVPVMPVGELAGSPIASMPEIEVIAELVDLGYAEVYDSSSWVIDASPALMACLFGEDSTNRMPFFS